MFISPRHIYRKVYGVLNAVVAVDRYAHEVSPSRLALCHVADSLLKELALGKNSDDKYPVLNKTDSAVLKFPCRISLTVYIAYLLHFETALEAYGIVEPAPYEEYIMSVGILRCKPLYPLLVLKDAFYLVRDGLQLFNIITVVTAVQPALCRGNSQCKSIHRRKLRAVRLGGSHCYFRPCKSVQHIVRLSCDS